MIEGLLICHLDAHLSSFRLLMPNAHAYGVLGVSRMGLHRLPSHLSRRATFPPIPLLVRPNFSKPRVKTGTFLHGIHLLFATIEESQSQVLFLRRIPSNSTESIHSCILQAPMREREVQGFCPPAESITYANLDTPTRCAQSGSNDVNSSQ
jgi:hypothetical protein